MERDLREWLPGIDIAISIEPREFLERMAVIGEQSGQFIVERHYDAIKNGALDIINFRYLGATVHTGVGGQLIAREDRPGRILVEMRAEFWDPDPPTRATYCEALDTQLRPLLRIYNRTFATRYRFRIQSSAPRPPRLSPLTMKLFDRFAILANTTSLHPLDWARFYAMVHEGRQEISGYQLRSMLVKAGFSQTRAEDLAELYVHLWNFKRRRFDGG